MRVYIFVSTFLRELLFLRILFNFVRRMPSDFLRELTQRRHRVIATAFVNATPRKQLDLVLFVWEYDCKRDWEIPTIRSNRVDLDSHMMNWGLLRNLYLKTQAHDTRLFILLFIGTSNDSIHTFCIGVSRMSEIWVIRVFRGEEGWSSSDTMVCYDIKWVIGIPRRCGCN